MWSYIKSLLAKYMFKAELAKLEAIADNLLVKAETATEAEIAKMKAEVKVEAANVKLILSALKKEAVVELAKAHSLVLKFEEEVKAEIVKLEELAKSEFAKVEAVAKKVIGKK